MRPSPFALAQGAATAVVLARLSRGRSRREPLKTGGSPPPTVKISVVIPARDEAERLGPCLDGLREDPDVGELVVVDDCSTDATAEVARAGGARVLAGAPLPPGWCGKPWALRAGPASGEG